MDRQQVDALIERLHSGDLSVKSEILLNLQKWVWSMAWKVERNTNDVPDVAQEIFLLLWTLMDDHPHHVEKRLIVRAFYAVRSLMRDRHKRPEFDPLEYLHLHPQTVKPDLYSDSFETILSQLDEKDRELVCVFVEEAGHQQDMAVRLGIGRSAVNHRLKRMRKKYGTI